MRTLLLKLEPLIWFMFGQGIMIGTMLLTGWILVLGILMPLGICLLYTSPSPRD